MDTWTAVFLLSCFLFTSSVQSAPVGSLSSLPPAFEETATQAKTLVEKILKDIPAAHSAAVSIQGLGLESSTQMSNLQMMEVSLGIPAAPVLKKLSEHFTLDTCVSRMSAGIQLYQNLLAVLSQNLSGLEDLRSDLRDLLTHINKLKEVAQLAGDDSDQNPGLDPVSRFQDSYSVQVAVHLTLMQLRSFCHDLIRTFRVLHYRAAGTH
ncbi:colony stimulating factor 3 (granulocyte) a [Nematolebias whitei]|uniref:colony stimulating factor 3 (granulocyte) a n=1 Tax=Nematolebias whitei TaxID=451745 RepID=UPI001899C2FA|nr:colony stimulating factor 3 (granulocyte) a [Nematolebias whitei]